MGLRSIAAADDPVAANLMDGELKVFSGTANRGLADKVCREIGVVLGDARLVEFPDGEILTKIETDVRGRDVFVIQPTSYPVNHNIMELLIFLDALRRASAKRITAVLPYYGYARQDRKDEGRTPITAKLVANLITSAGADRVITVDLHASQIQGFFDIPVDHLTAEPVICKHYKTKKLDNAIMVSPDVGNTKRAIHFTQRLNLPLAIIEKRRTSGSDAKAANLIGDVKGKTVIMVDDMISTAGTMVEAAKLVKDKGAEQVLVGATHAVLAGPAVERLKSAPVDEIVVTDTIPVREAALKELPRLKVLSVAGLLGKAIHRIHRDESVSTLFDRDQA
jgi:ribose-phosphate pyrophosphokinase